MIIRYCMDFCAGHRSCVAPESVQCFTPSLAGPNSVRNLDPSWGSKHWNPCYHYAFLTWLSAFGDSLALLGGFGENQSKIQDTIVGLALALSKCNQVYVNRIFQPWRWIPHWISVMVLRSFGLFPDSGGVHVSLTLYKWAVHCHCHVHI